MNADIGAGIELHYAADGFSAIRGDTYDYENNQNRDDRSDESGKGPTRSPAQCPLDTMPRKQKANDQGQP
ncbi:hypothetical protein, partial [Escherichia coli]|uniref:hypothetical protein n=2 Tax=Enterobacteriaceae TaxID=543 RepID=UPI0015BE936C